MRPAETRKMKIVALFVEGKHFYKTGIGSGHGYRFFVLYVA
jgi:hypothetical protein